MTTIIHDADAANVPAGDALAVQLAGGVGTQDLTEQAEAGVLFVLVYNGNVTTGDPVGDAYAAADLADKLDLQRNPTPLLVLDLDPEASRERSATTAQYAATFADSVAARGYRPVIRSTPDVIFNVARGSARFDGSWPVAFDLANPGGVVPVDPRQSPGLPEDIFTGFRAYTYATGETIADEGQFSKVSPPVTPSDDATATPAGGVPRFSNEPVPDAVSQDDHDALAAKVGDVTVLADTAAQVAGDAAAKADDVAAKHAALETQLADALEQLAQLQATIAELRTEAGVSEDAGDHAAG